MGYTEPHAEISPDNWVLILIKLRIYINTKIHWKSTFYKLTVFKIRWRMLSCPDGYSSLGLILESFKIKQSPSTIENNCLKKKTYHRYMEKSKDEIWSF